MSDASRELGRLEAFCDGVFAIAITLLVLEVRIPHAGSEAMRSGLWHALGALWPSYVGYAISFITIGIMWINHHAMLKYMQRADRPYLVLTVLFLMAVSFVPFPTAILAEYLCQEAERARALMFYSLFMVVVALAFNAVWWYGVRGGRLTAHDANQAGIATLSRRYAAGPVLYATCAALALASPWASLALHGALTVFWLLPERRA